MSGPQPRLRCMSFHSVKGGVGKSTLAAAAAATLAPRVGRTFFVDFDLTGTSVADILKLEAPSWPVKEGNVLDLEALPNAFHSVDESRRLVGERGFAGVQDLHEKRATPPRYVPFLNDYLLYTHPSWSPENDLGASRLAWRWGGVQVMPSSALPADVARILPLVYDEEHAGFLESRVEWFLDQLVPAPGETAAVVFDTPPTIPGLSRSILSIALRLSRQPRMPLASGGSLPPRLAGCDLQWRAYVVVSQDAQDIVAAGRWLDLTTSEDLRVVSMIANRLAQTDRSSLEAALRACSVEERFVKDALAVRNDPRMNLRSWDAPPSDTSLGEAMRETNALHGFLP